jgi:hypothetical protein
MMWRGRIRTDATPERSDLPMMTRLRRSDARERTRSDARERTEPSSGTATRRRMEEWSAIRRRRLDAIESLRRIESDCCCRSRNRHCSKSARRKRRKNDSRRSDWKMRSESLYQRGRRGWSGAMSSWRSQRDLSL